MRIPGRQTTWGLTTGVIALVITACSLLDGPVGPIDGPYASLVPEVMIAPEAVITARPVAPQPEPEPIVVPAPTDAPAKVVRSVSGRATWYCLAGVSVCHKDASGGLYAAACAKLRRAMGKGWRGKTVTVESGGEKVRVKLIDFCESGTKLIDLYSDAFRRLAPISRGNIRVRVTW